VERSIPRIISDPVCHRADAALEKKCFEFGAIMLEDLCLPRLITNFIGVV